MEKVKIHPLILAALLFSSIAMAMYAYRNFQAEENGYGIVFALLCVFFLGFVVFGLMRNRKVTNEKAVEN